MLTHVMLTTCRALEHAGGIADLSYELQTKSYMKYS